VQVHEVPPLSLENKGVQPQDRPNALIRDAKHGGVHAAGGHADQKVFFVFKAGPIFCQDLVF
jgi:hypothetical protein